MGCINDRERIGNRTGAPTLTQPTIIEPTPNNLLNPQPPVCSIACGYTFTPDAYTGEILRTKTQLTLQSTTISPSDQLATLIKKCQNYYQLHDLDTAHDYLTLVYNLNAKYQRDPQYSQHFEHAIAHNATLLASIKEEYQEIIQYENQILKGGWVEKSNRKGVRVSTRREDGTVGVLVESIVDEPFEVLISFCIEMDLYHQFMPFMKISRQEKIVKRNCRIGFTENHIPIVSVREAFFQGIGYNRLHKNNTLFLFTRSIHNRPDIQDKLGYKCQIHEDYVQLQYKYFVLWYEPLSRGKGKITLAMNVDTKMNFIPMWLQDKISQDFGEQFFENIIRLSKKFKGSQWEKNTQANPELFLFFKNAIDNRLREMEQAQKSDAKMKTNVSYETNALSSVL